MSVGRRPVTESDPAPAAALDQGGVVRVGQDAEVDLLELDAEALRVISDEISRDFEPALGRTALVLYDLDPTHLLTQWYVAPEEVTQAAGSFPGGQADLSQVLRLCLLDRDGRSQVVAASSQEVGSAPSRGQESFILEADGASYECELGLESGNGGWLLLARSNRIQMAAPIDSPMGPVASADEVQARGQRQFVADEPPEVAVDAALAEVGGPLDPVFPNLGPVIDPPATRRFLPAAEVPDREETCEKVSPTLPETIGESTPEVGGVPIVPSSQALAGMPPPRLPSDSDSGMRTGDMPGTLYDPRAALSSATLRGVEPRWGDLDIRGELVVQGKGQPGARVELFGLPVRVEADGHFSVRRTVDAALLLSLVLGRDSAPNSGDPDRE